VVINQFDVKRVGTLKSENDAPIGSHRHRPKSSQVALQWMQAISRKIERLGYLGSIKAAKNILDCISQVGPNAAGVIALVEPLQALVSESPNHSL
jgi:hypothetical protein